MYVAFVIVVYIFFQFPVSGSNLATHIVGSLKKGKSLTPIPPTNHSYNTLPSNHSSLAHSRTASDGMILPSPNLSLPPAHKRSPSSDSGNAGSRSTTPVSYHMGKMHTVFLNGNYQCSVLYPSCSWCFCVVFVFPKK